MEDKFLNKRYVSLDGNYRLYMNHDGVFKEVAPFLLRRRKISSDKLFYRLEDLPHSYRVKFEDMAISASELVGAKVGSFNGKMYVYDDDRTKVLVTESTPLMPIVGNFLPSDGVNAYTVKITNGKYKLMPILICVSCHWADLFSGNTKYGENVFCLASDLPRELLEKHIEEIITLGEVPKFLNMNKEEFSKKF